MALFTESKLREAVEAGRVNLLATLASERNLAEVMVMPTLGALSASLTNSESDAAAKVALRAEEAKSNIEMLERIMAERGESSQTFVCKSCGKHRTRPTCEMCAEPEEY